MNLTDSPQPPNSPSTTQKDEAEEKHSLKEEKQNEHCHHFEQVFDKIKQYGRYQIFSFILIQYIM